jgi:hypothetical protein
LAAYLVGAYRDTVVRVERPAFVEYGHSAQDAAREARGMVPQRRLPRVGYLPASGGWHRLHGPRGGDGGPPGPHAVAWYIRRLRPGHRTRPAALTGGGLVDLLRQACIDKPAL